MRQSGKEKPDSMEYGEPSGRISVCLFETDIMELRLLFILKLNVTEDDFELVIFLPAAPEFWDYKCVQLDLVFVLGVKPGAS